MKLVYLYTVALSSAIAFAFAEGRALTAADVLKAKWALNDPETVYDPGTNTFAMTYPGTDDSILPDNIQVQFFDKNCKDPAPSQYEPIKGIDDIDIKKIAEGKLTYTFPTTDTRAESVNSGPNNWGFLHGLCVLDAQSAEATSSNTDFTYETISGFKTGTQLWGDRTYGAVGDIEAGGSELCAGGLYLQPSSVYGPPSGTDITIEATPENVSEGVTVCAFNEAPWFYSTENTKFDRSSNWHNLLPERGFTESVATLGYLNYANNFKFYCKTLLPNNNQATLSFKLDTEVLAKDDNIYTSPSSDTDEGKMEICTRTSLGYVDGNDFTEVNFVESLLTIKYNLQDDFDLSDFNVAPKAKDTSTGSKEYAVEASLCSGSVAPFNQGSLICVEVKPNDDSAKDGIVMKSIDSFDWKRGDTTQQAITGSNAVSNNELTSITCVANSEKCSIKSVLFADFYESSGQVSGSGSATMMFKSNSRALMGGSTSASSSGRSLQEAATAATSEFDITIPVGASDDGVGALKTAAAGAAFGFTALASIVGGLVSAVLLV